ncbi:MAG: GGDEF domain-containing protein, partial [Planctomycetes bacterium]|nr:GGDEF domain-containing protein [Planctomycetota bacterium]
MSDMSESLGTVVVAASSHALRERIADLLGERADVTFVAPSESVAQDVDVAIPDDCSRDELARIISLLARLAAARADSNVAQAGAKRWARLAETDPLTNLMNRRAFMNAAADAMRYYQRYNRAIATLVVDIDHFKRINDEHGHAAGDGVIRRVSELIAQTLRETDKVARFGGEEFVVLLREVSEPEAQELAERIRLVIANSQIPFDGKELSVTVSIGCAATTAQDRDVEELIERADRALYAAKAA